jgi:hypothetical protein
MQEGVLSEDDSMSSLKLIEAPADPFDPIERSLFSDDYHILDDDFMLDTTQDLPIRKPQSAYVIFGKMVSLCLFVIL